ncbi:hypothetical protein ECEC1870_3317, partial [Escherichia coli EC1870]
RIEIFWGFSYKKEMKYLKKYLTHNFNL